MFSRFARRPFLLDALLRWIAPVPATLSSMLQADRNAVVAWSGDASCAWMVRSKSRIARWIRRLRQRFRDRHLIFCRIRFFAESVCAIVGYPFVIR